MATYTENYRLKKPDPEDFVDIADINANMELVDDALSTHTHAAADITSGVLPVAQGGTGGSSAPEARKNLGLEVMSLTEYQALEQKEEKLYFCWE